MLSELLLIAPQCLFNMAPKGSLPHFWVTKKVFFRTHNIVLLFIHSSQVPFHYIILPLYSTWYFVTHNITCHHLIQWDGKYCKHFHKFIFFQVGYLLLLSWILIPSKVWAAHRNNPGFIRVASPKTDSPLSDPHTISQPSVAGIFCLMHSLWWKNAHALCFLSSIPFLLITWFNKKYESPVNRAVKQCSVLMLLRNEISCNICTLPEMNQICREMQAKPRDS